MIAQKPSPTECAVILEIGTAVQCVEPITGTKVWRIEDWKMVVPFGVNAPRLAYDSNHQPIVYGWPVQILHEMSVRRKEWE